MKALDFVPLQESSFDYLEAIRQSPDDDVPRLAYADWLELNGDHDRAEFIRLQCWLSANPESHPEWDGKWQREQALLRKNVAFWSLLYTPLIDRECAFWDRGFPSYLEAGRPGDFCEWAGYLSEIIVTTRLVIRCTIGLDHDVVFLARSPELSQIRELWTNDVAGSFPPNELSTLLNSPYAQNLRRLSFIGSQWDNHHECEFLAAEPVLPHLRHLGCGLVFRVDVERVISLLRSPYRHELRGLEVWNLDTADLKVLCDCPALSRLTHLDLGSWEISDDGIRYLVECPYLDSIQYLSLWCDNADSAETLSDSSRAAFFNRFGNRGNLSAIPYVGGPEKEMHRWRIVTGRSR